MRPAVGAERRPLPGEMPLEDSMAMLNATDIDPERAKLLAEGMQTLVGVLGLLSGHDDAPLDSAAH